MVIPINPDSVGIIRLSDYILIICISPIAWIGETRIGINITLTGPRPSALGIRIIHKQLIGIISTYLIFGSPEYAIVHVRCNADVYSTPGICPVIAEGAVVER